LAVVDLGPGDPTRTFSMATAPGRILATRGGRQAFSFASSSVSPVVISAAHQWNEPRARMEADAWAFRPAQDLRRFRYVLVRITDLPYHEAGVAILRHFDDVTKYPPGLYRRNLGEPNQLFHMIAWALSYVISTRWAVKLVVAASVLAIPVAGARLARYVGSSPLSSSLLSPLALGWLFSWGLVANLLGIAVFMLMAPTLDRFAREPTGRGAVKCMGA